MKLKERKYYNGIHYFIDKENQVVKLEQNFHQNLLKNMGTWNGFKKIGGSSIGDVLQTDAYKSEFLAFIRMAKLDMPILDTKYIDAGVAIEPMVINVIREKSKQEIEVFPPEKYAYDYFKGKDDIIGGIPDGYIKKLNMILEIKTTGIKNLEKWENGEIPVAYLKQAQLYSYLMNCDTFAIVATFLHPEDYDNPQNYPIKERKIRTYKFKTNVAQIEDDIQKIKKWYTHYTNLGISPKYNQKIDGELLDYLECRNQQEWNDLLKKWQILGKVKISE
ncbi:MAGa7180 family putative nuclease [Mesomycoplasma lagogenitalium]|uniref:YqaJ viral recombinase family protein n=1 Tax=Mesomycoplasma lagogenitalium TaxID=171286 RepID=A0ABY8LUY1_9BACT|nr:YqaJ viral recombinase family protein [Mesomycoplasma lagogenitalium]WGI37040.1 YqaJ viral recombinase family protein [Mesomycoplasma lagogenitalium]